MATPDCDTSVRHQALVDKLQCIGVIRTSRVEAAFRAVPRHVFLPEVPLELVYTDEAIPTKQLDGATVSSSSQPAIMAIMLEQLQLAPGQRVLEIGAGTGYNAALIAHITGETGQVVTVDLDEDLAAGAREHLAAAGIDRVQVVCGDGGLGYVAAAPYDRILLTVGAADILPAWQEQLGPEGRLVLPLSIRGPQLSAAFEHRDGCLQSVSLEYCGFMMLRGAFSELQKVALGPAPGLSLAIDDPARVDAEAAYRWLTSPSRDLAAAVRVTTGDVFGSLRLWLALHEPGFTDLEAVGEWVDRGLLPSLYGWRSGGWNIVCTCGLVAERGLCVLMRRDAAEPPNDEQSFELSVRGYGPHEGVAHRAIEQIQAWDAAGRPSTDHLRIRVLPRQPGYRPAAGETVVPRRWTQLVLDWT